jgi:hypothetical protein
LINRSPFAMTGTRDGPKQIASRARDDIEAAPRANTG